MPRVGGPLSVPMSGRYRCYNPSVFASLLVPLVHNRHMHEDPGVPLFADHIRALAESFDSKLADVGNPPLTATRQIRKLTEG